MAAAITAALSIPENTTAVTTVAATDPDPGTNLIFSLAGGPDSDKFNINTTTGARVPHPTKFRDSHRRRWRRRLHRPGAPATALADIQTLSVTVTGTGSTNQPPSATITLPAPNTTYRGGTVITYSGTATDPEEGPITDGNRFTWQVDVIHDSHAATRSCPRRLAARAAPSPFPPPRMS